MTDHIEYPLVTEKAMMDMDYQNKLQFLCTPESTKPEIAAEVEERFDVSVVKVNTQLTMEGKKKATLTLGEDDDAQEVASRMGMF